MCSNNKKVPIVRQGGHIVIQQQTDGSNKITYIEEEYKFAFELRNAARVMVNSAKKTKDGSSTHWKLKAFIHGAIILSYASLEAALNEIIFIHALTENSPLNDSERKVLYTIAHENLESKESSHVLSKYNMLLRILGRPEFDTGSREYQNANLVRILRNMIVHPIPGRVVTYKNEESFDYSSQQDIVKRLRSALGLKRTSIFPRDIITKECASWAVSSCEIFLHEFLKKSGIDIGFITD